MIYVLKVGFPAVFLMLSFNAGSSSGLSFSCPHWASKTPKCCPFGELVQDPCGHFTVCLVGHLEQCGGPYSMCRSGLDCLVYTGATWRIPGIENGICVRKPETNLDCRTRGTANVECLPTLIYGDLANPIVKKALKLSNVSNRRLKVLEGVPQEVIKQVDTCPSDETDRANSAKASGNSVLISEELSRTALNHGTRKIRLGKPKRTEEEIEESHKMVKKRQPHTDRLKHRVMAETKHKGLYYVINGAFSPSEWP